MSPEELRANLKADDDDLEEYMSWMKGNTSVEASTENPEAMADFLDVSLALANNRCPKCDAPMEVTPIGESSLSEYSCSRFGNQHSWLRTTPIQINKGVFS